MPLCGSEPYRLSWLSSAADWSLPRSRCQPQPNFVSVFIDTPGPRGSIAVVGDSVMLGSAYEPPLVPGWGPSLARMLADRGWGPVHMAAGVGFQAGKMVPGQPRRQHVAVARRTSAPRASIRR